MTNEAALKMFKDAADQGFDYCPHCADFEACNERIKNGANIPELEVCFVKVKKGYEDETAIEFYEALGNTEKE